MRLLPVLVAFAAVLVSLRLSSPSSPRLSSAAPFTYGTSPAENALPAALPPDDRLTRLMERHFVGNATHPTFEAPEHFAFGSDGAIYFGVSDGRILRTRADPLTGALSEPELVLYTGDPLLADRLHPCGSEESEALCGRPLGMAFDRDGLLLVADCYLGLLEVDVVARTKRVLLREVDGLPLYFANSVVVGPRSGTVYLTDSSQRWRRREFIYEVMESTPTGRLIAFDRQTGRANVHVHGIAFANGLLVDPRAEAFLLFNELNRVRILRFDLTKHAATAGPVDASAVLPTDGRPLPPNSSSSPLSILIANLPGVPDNLAWEAAAAAASAGVSEGVEAKRGNAPHAAAATGPLYFWTGCGTARTAPFSLTDALAGWPSVRAVMAALLPKQLFLRLVPRIGLLLRLQIDEAATGSSSSVPTAHIVESLQDPKGARTALLTGAYEHQGYLYIGSISHDVNFLPRIAWTAANRTDTTHRWTKK